LVVDKGLETALGDFWLVGSVWSIPRGVLEDLWKDRYEKTIFGEKGK
jgi:hypothetical protein